VHKHVLFNGVGENRIEQLKLKLQPLGFNYLGCLPHDGAVEEQVFNGRSLYELNGTPVTREMDEIIEKTNGGLMQIIDVKEKWTNRINTVTLGATKAMAARAQKTVTVGGETTLPFLTFEGEIPNPPALAGLVVDVVPEGWSDGSRRRSDRRSTSRSNGRRRRCAIGRWT